MRKFSIPGRYFIVHGRYLCPGVFPARGGWPWNAGNARFPEGPGRAGSLKVGSGSGGFRDGSRVGGCRDGFKAGSRGVRSGRLEAAGFPVQYGEQHSEQLRVG